MAELLTLENLVALLALTFLEIVLGIDNVVFIAVITGRLPEERRALARRLGLGLAMAGRILLLLAISWVMGLVTPLFSIFDRAVSWRDLILFLGGLFLILKATHEVHKQIEAGGDQAPTGKSASFWGIIAQILVLDLVFSLDSVITAVGMARALPVMIAAIVIAVLIMVAFAGWVSAIIERHPSLKVLALSFLLLVGVVLVAEGVGQHIPRGYIYFAMAFSLGVELINLKSGAHRARQADVGK